MKIPLPLLVHWRPLRALPASVLLVVGACGPGSPRNFAPMGAHADVVCDAKANRALVRFVIVGDDEKAGPVRLADEIDGGLSGAEWQGLESCRLLDGRKVVVRSLQGRAYGYGQGYGDPSAHFSLWLDDRKLIDRRQWKPGYGEDNGELIVAIVVNPNSFTTCRTAYDAPDDPTRIQCTKEDFGSRTTPIAAPSDRGSAVEANTAEPEFCRRFLARRPLDLLTQRAFEGPVSWMPLARLENLPGALEREDRLFAGKSVYRTSSDTHYFDGEVWFLVPPDEKNVRATLARTFVDDSEKLDRKAFPTHWIVLSGQQPSIYPAVSWRYVHFSSLTFEKRDLIFAWPTNPEQKPAGILLEIGGRSPSVVCRFQQIDGL